jgi:hypothetical protein
VVGRRALLPPVPLGQGINGTLGSRRRHDGVAPLLVEVGYDIKSSMGLSGDVNRITHRDLQERRALIRKRMEERRRR